MSERTDLEIKDLTPEETLTPEEKERLAGAGRVRPMFELLEAREMMSANNPLGGVVTSSAPAGAGTALVRNATPTVEAKWALTEKHTYSGASDASAAVPIQFKEGGVIKDGVLVGDDKSDVIRLYDSQTGKVVWECDLGSVTGTKFQPDGTGVYKDSDGKYWPTSSDIEAAARVDDKIYWMTSHGDIIETRMVLGKLDGGFIQGLEPVQKVTGLWDKIADSTDARNTKLFDTDGKRIDIKSDVYRGEKLFLKTGDQLTLDKAMKASDAELKQAFKGDDKFEAKNYRNIEGFAIRPNSDGTLTGYIGFRAPLVGDNGEALVVSVKNFQNWISKPSTTPEFGTPILLRLGAAEQGHKYGGLGIRDIVWSQDAGKFVIIGGIYGVGTDFTLGTHIYTWNPDSGSVLGQSVFKPERLSKEGDFRSGEKNDAPGRDQWMSLEAIGEISVNADGKIVSIQLLSDDGSTGHGKNDPTTATGKREFQDRYFWGGVYKVQGN